MFTIDSNQCNTVRTTLVYEYQVRVSVKRHFCKTSFQEQQSTLEVVFICTDGEQRSSREVLEIFSDWFARQMKARERFNNRIEFNYAKDEPKFDKRTIQNFLDAMHGIRIESITLVETLQLIRFIQYEGKNGKLNCSFQFCNQFPKQVHILNETCSKP